MQKCRLWQVPCHDLNHDFTNTELGLIKPRDVLTALTQVFSQLVADEAIPDGFCSVTTDHGRDIRFKNISQSEICVLVETAWNHGAVGMNGQMVT